MKKHLVSILLLVAAFLFQACEGPVGPQGPPGRDGTGLSTRIIELDRINFTPSNGFSIRYEFPANKLEVLEGDIVMVYMLWEMDGNIPIWRALPQQAFFQNGILQYNFSHTFIDVDIFMDGQVDLSTLSSEWRSNQTFRIAVIPTEYVQGLRTSGVDYTNYNEVAKFLNVSEEEVLKVPIN
jgi:hypothetical protein